MIDKYLVAYDIADNKRINKAARILLDYGIRVQKSVYEVRLSEIGLKEMCERLQKVIDAKKDGIKIFPLCGFCVSRGMAVGKFEQLQNTGAWLIL